MKTPSTNRLTLLEIGARTKSSKWGAHSYLPVYDRLFLRFRDLPITLVEFGIDQGNSLLMWLEYFPKARIIGIDNMLENVTRANVLDRRITAHHHQQQDAEVGRIMATFKPHVIIDDAGHDHQHQSICFAMCWEHLQQGGYYVVEDIQRGCYVKEWRERGAEIYEGYTSSELGDYRYDDVLAIFEKE